MLKKVMVSVVIVYLMIVPDRLPGGKPELKVRQSATIIKVAKV